MEKLAIFGGEPVRRTSFPRWPVFDDRERKALNDVLESGIWGGYHPAVQEFEQRFASFHQTRFGVTAANGTVTLEAALIAAGIGPGDEVIVPPISFIATATAVLRVGATPIFVDIEETTCNLDPAQVVDSITPRVRALIPVHFAGHPADMDAIMPLAEQHNLNVIEDCAHAHGASWRGQKVGSFGHFGSFSFQASKNMTAGEGGILLTNDSDLAEAARSVCNQGRRTGGGWYEHVRLGTNYRLSGWQAAVLLAQLTRLPDQLLKRTANARLLTEKLREFDIVTPPPIDERVTEHSYYLYLLRLNLDRAPGLTRANFVKALSAEGIPCHEGYPHPLYRNEVFNQGKRYHCDVAERMCSDTFWLSHEVLLATENDLSDVVTAISKVAQASQELNRLSS